MIRIFSFCKQVKEMQSEALVFILWELCALHILRIINKKIFDENPADRLLFFGFWCFFISNTKPIKNILPIDIVVL